MRYADWSIYRSKVEWLNHAIPQLRERQWYWIDDEVKYFEKEIKELNLPKDRCIQVSAKGAGALEELRSYLQRQRGGLEKLHYDEVKKTLASR
jgi:hypothetical protein